MKPYAKRFYHSDKWQNCRNAYIQNRLLIDGGLCEDCREEQGYIVHHIIHLTESNINNPEISLNPDNLMYVCKKCHDQYEGHGLRGRKGKELSVIFNEQGQPIKRR